MIYLRYPGKVAYFHSCKACKGQGVIIIGTDWNNQKALICQRCVAGERVDYLTRGRSLIPLISRRKPSWQTRIAASVRCASRSISRALSPRP